MRHSCDQDVPFPENILDHEGIHFVERFMIDDEDRRSAWIEFEGMSSVEVVKRLVVDVGTDDVVLKSP